MLSVHVSFSYGVLCILQSSSISKYRGIVHATRAILAEEGVHALWSVAVAKTALERNTQTKYLKILLCVTCLSRKGLTPGLLLYFMFGGIQVLPTTTLNIAFSLLFHFM